MLSCIEKGVAIPTEQETPPRPPLHTPQQQPQQQQHQQQQQQQQQQQHQQQQDLWSYDVESLLILYGQRRIDPSEGTLSPNQEKELQEVLQTLETEATADHIRAARRWAEVCCSGNSSSNSSSSEADAAAAAALAAAMYRHQKALKTPTHKLHALYLAHDIVQVNPKP